MVDLRNSTCCSLAFKIASANAKKTASGPKAAFNPAPSALVPASKVFCPLS